MKAVLCVCLLVFAFSAQAVTFISTDIPKAIPDGPSGIANSYLTIPDNYRISDLNITVTIQHPFTGDLRLYLISPQNETVRLADRVGHSGNNYTGTTFDDEAGTAIEDSEAPFSGSFRPDQSLENFDLLETWGTWTFRVTDNGQNDVGTILAWQITIEGTPLATPEPVTLLPRELDLSVAPNPFNATTRIFFSVAKQGPLSLAIFDVTGRQMAVLADESFPPGDYHRNFNATALPTGVYFARINTPGASRTTRLLLVK